MSRRIAILMIATWAAALGVAEARAETVTLKAEVYVKGPRVLLGDVATVSGEDAELLKRIVLAPAAMPGSYRRLNAALVRSRLIEGGLEEWEIEIVGSRQVTATTLHLEVTGGMIAEDLREFIRREMPWDPDATIVEVFAPASKYIVSDGTVDFRWRANPQYQYLGRGSFRGEILVDGQVEKTFFAKAKISTYEEVIIASAAIARGDTISTVNTHLENRELSALKGKPYFALDEIRGYVAKSSIYPGQIITPRKIAPRILVKRNQIIVVETTLGALTISGRGRALNAAAAGELVRAVNETSKEEFSGLLRADGVLVVD